MLPQVLVINDDDGNDDDDCSATDNNDNAMTATCFSYIKPLEVD